jgi:hypothetical protein
MAASIYSVEGIAGMAGRLGFGVVADRLGAKNVLAWGLLLQAFGALGSDVDHQPSRSAAWYSRLLTSRKHRDR